MATRRFSVPVTTDASGNATAYSPYLSGFIESVHYVKTDYADGVDSFAKLADDFGIDLDAYPHVRTGGGGLRVRPDGWVEMEAAPTGRLVVAVPAAVLRSDRVPAVAGIFRCSSCNQV